MYLCTLSAVTKINKQIVFLEVFFTQVLVVFLMLIYFNLLTGLISLQLALHWWDCMVGLGKRTLVAADCFRDIFFRYSC